MAGIARRIFLIIATVIILFIVLFALVWVFDGFPAAVSLLFGGIGAKLLDFFLSIGVTDLFISLIASLLFCLIFETVLGKKISSRKARMVCDIVAFFISFLAIIISIY